ncbi:short chain dehydrogenase [Noviherbaspirillum sp. CPCC 100848]|uniref:Short chain dehydrogenase n=1 Tax=Noviherbaspirillum album TaxID=3080276 RepID=A0ABU6JHS5_9BURK|nr:short chain dehydrogenase [Noviherbaspirillum sp. CPCC 100848]MEC4723206.1 short chain dehydrogenase [Noviherbaspirillum sp. CPCC 100848]
MKVIVIGATGTIGRAVSEQLAARHEVIRVGRSGGQHQVDIADPASVEALFRRIGPADAVVVTAGNLHFGPLAELDADKMNVGLQHKLMGQVNVALAAQRHLNDGGSITLTSGIVGAEPIRYGINATTVNTAVDGFVRAAAIELPRGLRINVVDPSVLQESMKAYGPYFHGFEPVPASRVAQAYSRSVDGLQTGKVYRVW